MAKTIYLIRHGQSIDSQKERFQSASSPLNEEGILQSQQLSKEITALNIDLLVSSPLARALETAEIIAKEIHQEIRINDLFKEGVKPSSVDGKLSTDTTAVEIMKNWESSLYGNGAKILDGETFEELLSRADQAINFLVHANATRIAIVSHGFFTKTILARITYKDELTGEKLKAFQNSYKSSNTGITTLTYNEESKEWKILSVNDARHTEEN